MRISDWSSDVCSSDLLAVDAIHNERGYREIRRSLARQYDVGWTEPDIQVVDVDMAGDRHLKLEHAVTNGILLAQSDAEQVVQHLANLWGYGTVLSEVDREGGKMLKRSEEHTSELQSLMRISYAVLCLKKKTTKHN